jgi:predicted transcriptional regulator
MNNCNGVGQVIEMRARGMSQAEIARELQVSEASISLEMQYLSSQAKESIKEYATEYLPEQNQICLSWLDEISRVHLKYWRHQKTIEKIASYGAIQRCSFSQIRIVIQCTTVDSALNYIMNKQ